MAEGRVWAALAPGRHRSPSVRDRIAKGFTRVKDVVYSDSPSSWR